MAFNCEAGLFCKALKIPLCTFLGPKVVRTSRLLLVFTSLLPTTDQIAPTL